METSLNDSLSTFIRAIVNEELDKKGFEGEIDSLRELCKKSLEEALEIKGLSKRVMKGFSWSYFAKFNDQERITKIKELKSLLKRWLDTSHRLLVCADPECNVCIENNELIFETKEAIRD